LTFLLQFRLFSQNDPRYFLNFGLKLGSSVPLGSVSKNSTKTNDFGKYKYAFNTQVFAELILKKKYSLCVGYRYLDYSMTPSDAAIDPIKAKFASHYNDFYTLDEYDLAGGLFSLGISRIFQYNRLRFQTKLELALGTLEYDYQTIQSLPNNQNYKYSCDLPSAVFTLIPEVNLQYIFIKKSRVDFALMLSADLVRLNPKIKIMEHYQYYGGPNDRSVVFTTLQNPVTMLNINLGFCVCLKRK
jgi:hypothetical protein